MLNYKAFQTVLLLLACLSSGFAQQTERCASCHRGISLLQPLTDMGQASQMPGHNQALDNHPNLTFTVGQYHYSVITRNGKTTYTVSDGKHSISVPVLWAMGTPAQTWLLVYGDHWYASMVSYYPKFGLDVTLGDKGTHPTSLVDAIGRPLSKDGVLTCFECHSSNAVVHDKLHLSTYHPGLTCARCHTDLDAHLAEMQKTGIPTHPPPNLRKMSSEDISSFCGRCHRTFATVVRRGWRGPNNVRFQPYRLALSKCFSGTDPRISCIACHDPHVEVARSYKYYDQKCLACHSPSMSKLPPHAKVCPVSTSHCVSCHMPLVRYPGGHFYYRDHDIRIVKSKGSYPY